MAVWVRWSSFEPTILSLKNSIVTSDEPQESRDLAREQASVSPASEYFRKVFTKSGNLKLLLLTHFPTSRPQKSFLL